MPERKYPIADENPAAKLTERIVSSLAGPPVNDEHNPTQQGEGKANLERIDTYLYWNAFDHDLPK